MVKQLFLDYFPHIVWPVTILIVVFCMMSFSKIKGIMEIDKAFKKYDKDGTLLQETNPRNRWDYNIFGGLTRIWHKSEWQELVGMVLLFIFLFSYLFTRDEALLQLLGINFGVIFGMLIQRFRKDN